MIAEGPVTSDNLTVLRGARVAAPEQVIKALRIAREIFYEWDVRAEIISWIGDPAVVFGHGIADNPLNADQFQARLNSDDRLSRAVKLLNHLNGGEAFRCRYQIRCNDGAFQWVEEIAAAEFDDEGDPHRLMGSVRVISEQVLRSQELERRANYDELTAVPNRYLVREMIGKLLRGHQDRGDTSAYLLISIDRLGLLNKSYGHQLADEMIIRAIQSARDCIRDQDQVGRVDGNKFAVILGHCMAMEMEVIAETILEAVRMMVIETSDGPVSATASVGGIMFPLEADEVRSIMGRAEEALEDAKSNGRNCFVEYRLSNRQKQYRHKALMTANNALGAMNDNRLKLAFQPIVDSNTGKTVHAECLIRMEELDGRLTNAGVFMPSVEEVGLVGRVDKFVLDQAIAALQMRPALRVTVNVSGMTVLEPDAVDAMVAKLSAVHDVARRMTIEITETVAIRNLTTSAKFVAAMHGIGCGVALDDFGAGYTSFRQLKALDVDMVKIDGEFIRDLENAPRNQRLVQALVDISKAFEIYCVAECVETQNEAEILRKMGVDYFQGYGFGRPVLVPDFDMLEPESN